MAEHTKAEDALFVQQCQELSEKIVNLLVDYPKAVAICAVPGLMASMAKVYNLPRAMVIAMLDSALEDIADG